ncbi:MAG TPA: hypothetical protein VHR72_10530 [Gemmataceae bacterium]|jgi:hypothetical protein|nr:hypothetical protein [Gemmataceae bacterium]
MTTIASGVYVLGEYRVRFDGAKWLAMIGEESLGLHESREAAWEACKMRMDADRARKGG